MDAIILAKMEAKDTVITGVEEVNGTTFLPPDYISWREHLNLMEKQAEISFKVGIEKAEEGNLERCLLMYDKGIREVVEWLRRYAIHGGNVPLEDVLIDLRAHSPYGKPN